MPTKVLRRAVSLCCASITLFCLAAPRASAQTGDDVLSQREVDELRDAAFVPIDRISVFEQILDDRAKEINDLQIKRRGHTDFGDEMHDVVDQFGAIADELNDNLDEYGKHHRDVRKVLPRLLQATDRWSAALQAPADDEAYKIVRRIALDNVKDTHELAQGLETDLEAYFKAHPEAAKEEKKRNDNPHAVENPSGPE